MRWKSHKEGGEKMSSPHNGYFICGCYYSDINPSGISVTIRFNRCKKHQLNMKPCSWLSWAKANAPSQYKRYIKDMR